MKFNKYKYPYVVEQDDILIFQKLLVIASKRFVHLEILEWGCGGSTVYYPAYLDKLDIKYNWLSIEHHAGWHRKISGLINSRTQVKLFQVPSRYIRKCETESNPIKQAYIEYPLTLDKKYSLIYIDGRFRMKCLKTALKVLDDNGIIFIDNADYPHYQESLNGIADGKFIKPHLWMLDNGHRQTA